MPKPLQYRITTIVNQTSDTRYLARRKFLVFWVALSIHPRAKWSTRQAALDNIADDARSLRCDDWTVVSHEKIKV